VRALKRASLIDSPSLDGETRIPKTLNAISISRSRPVRTAPTADSASVIVCAMRPWVLAPSRRMPRASAWCASPT